jgi:hypothetical protein
MPFCEPDPSAATRSNRKVRKRWGSQHIVRMFQTPLLTGSSAFGHQERALHTRRGALSNLHQRMSSAPVLEAFGGQSLLLELVSERNLKGSIGYESPSLCSLSGGPCVLHKHPKSAKTLDPLKRVVSHVMY